MPDSNGKQLNYETDEEIVARIKSFIPITSEKNVWSYWNTGWDGMKPWTQRNVLAWVRLLGPEWTVRVLDRIPDSSNNVFNYLPTSVFPSAFNSEKLSGPYVGAHSADLVRLPCLEFYGGIWMDVSIVLFRHLDDVCWNVLTDPFTNYQMAGFFLPNNHKEFQHKLGYMENWFIAARAHNPFITKWREIFVRYWSDKGRTESVGVAEHPLFKHLEFRGYRQDMIDYLAQHASFQRLRMLHDTNDGFDGADFFANHMYLIDGLKEAYHITEITKCVGQDTFDLLKSPCEESAATKETIDVAEHMSKNNCLMKLFHGFKGDTQVSTLWNMDENAEVDITPYSLSNFLRNRPLEFNQGEIRKLEPLRPGPITEKVYKGGLFESFEKAPHTFKNGKPEVVEPNKTLVVGDDRLAAFRRATVLEKHVEAIAVM